MTILLALLLSSLAPLPSFAEATSRFCKPSEACWPSEESWKELEKKLTGKLLTPEAPLQACEADKKSDECRKALELQKNPFHLSDHAGATQAQGWLGAWKSALSARAVEAENEADIIHAVNFARDHKLRLVIRGTGHDWQGRSNAPDSLLLWTHKMRKVTFAQSWQPKCKDRKFRAPVKNAFTVEAGARWLDTYKEVMVKHQVYVQGGGCTTVGAAGGFLQGGGFSYWSKKFGTSAANLLEAEVVTADGQLVTANECQHQDLFWALRGGGGGTWGVVVKATMRTHPKPVAVGWVYGEVKAKSDEAYKEAIAKMLRFHRDHLDNEHWGDGFTLTPENALKVSYVFQGFPVKEAEKVLAPFFDWAKAQPEKFEVKTGTFEIPGPRMWDPEWVMKNFHNGVKVDTRPGEPGDNYWGSGSESAQTSVFWYAYQSRWIPISLFGEKKIAASTKTLFDASRHWPLMFFFGKGLSGATAFARKGARESSMNPAVLDAAGLLIATAQEEYPKDGAPPDEAKGAEQKKKVAAAMELVRAATPGAGTYFNQADYFERDWAEQFWGKNYGRLLAVKKKYDPANFFTCHHCVGSEL